MSIKFTLKSEPERECYKFSFKTVKSDKNSCYARTTEEGKGRLTGSERSKVSELWADRMEQASRLS